MAESKPMTVQEAQDKFGKEGRNPLDPRTAKVDETIGQRDRRVDLRRLSESSPQTLTVQYGPDAREGAVMGVLHAVAKDGMPVCVDDRDDMAKAGIAYQGQREGRLDEVNCPRCRATLGY